MITATGRRLKLIDNGTEPFLREVDSHFADFEFIIFSKCSDNDSMTRNLVSLGFLRKFAKQNTKLISCLF